MCAYLVRIYDHASLFIYLLCFILDNWSWSYAVMSLNKDRSFIMLTSSIRQCFIHMLYCSRMVFKMLADSLLVAICHLDWLHGRKYGTVWYHPASSMFYLILFHPLSVSGKIDWHASGFERPGLV
jgi:hypothetical protein